MKIGIDATFIVRKITSGIPVYHYNLVKNILKINTSHEIMLCYQGFSNLGSISDIQQFLSSKTRLVKLAVPGPLLKAGWRFLKFPPLELFCRGLDVFHYSQYALIPIYGNVKKIVTIYDVTPLLLPETHKFLTIDFFNRLIKFARNKADLIIAISLSTKNDLVNLCNVPEEKIRVVYGSMPDYLRDDFTHECSNEQRRIFSKKYHIGNNPYLLYVGSLEPRKNLTRAIEAFSLLKKSKSFKDYKFIFVSGERWKDSSLFEAVRKYNVKDDVRFSGYLSDVNELKWLYKNAALFIYPSLYEGFGLPTLEAMSFGVPVVTSNISSLPEVVGDAAIKINPYKVEEIYEAIKAVILDEELRAKLGKEGIERAKMFSWEKSARETLAVYEEAHNL